MLADDHSGAISGKNCTKMHIAQRKCSSSYHGFSYCDDVKGVLDKDRNIGDGICGIKTLKQNMKGRI